MNLKFDINLADTYSNASQIARVLTENWVKQNSYCPNCGKDTINNYPNNKPVADFFCSFCKEDFELKSKKGGLGRKVPDGAYSTMIERISAENNPNFFFLTYDKANWFVRNFIIIPKHFFQPEMIIKRNPLKVRPNYYLCDIDLKNIPELGKIFLVKDSTVTNRNDVLETWKKTVFLRNETPKSKGWTLDTLNIISRIDSNEFTLKDVYKFEEELKAKYPGNNTIQEQLRKQLQILRDKNIIEFVSRGKYRKIEQ